MHFEERNQGPSCETSGNFRFSRKGILYLFVVHDMESNRVAQHGSQSGEDGLLIPATPNVFVAMRDSSLLNYFREHGMEGDTRTALKELRA